MVVLVEFHNKNFIKTGQDFDNLYNQHNYVCPTCLEAYGSINDYYSENSYNQLNISAVVYPSICRASHQYSYYEYNPTISTQIDTAHIRDLAVEILSNVSRNINFNNLDGDEDGFVDAVNIIIPGYGLETGANSSLIWSHQFNLNSAQQETIRLANTANTVKVAKCFITPELRDTSDSNISSIGTICHELGHIFGAPDFYDIHHHLIATGKLDVMSSGSYNYNGDCPSHHNPYTKTKIFHWTNTNTINKEDRKLNIIIRPSSLYKDIYSFPTNTNGEYYLIENRQLLGFDRGTNASGMFVYHIHKDIVSASINNNINNFHILHCYIVNASALDEPYDSTTYGSHELLNRNFPGFNTMSEFENRIFFTSQSTPRSQSWAGDSTGVDICFIKRSGNNINFVVNPEIVCDTILWGDSSIYSLPYDIPTGATIQWSFQQKSLNATVAFQIINIGNNSIKLKKYLIPNFRDYGDEPPSWDGPIDSHLWGILNVTISTSASSYTIHKNIYKSQPNVSVTNNTNPWYRLQWRTFSITNFGNDVATNFSWKIFYYRNSILLREVTSTGRSMQMRPSLVPTTNNVKIIAYHTIAGSGIDSTTLSYYVSNAQTISIFDTANQITIEIDNSNEDIEIKPSKEYKVEIWHENFSLIREYNTREHTIQIEKNNMPGGMYIVRVTCKGALIGMEKFIVHR